MTKVHVHSGICGFSVTVSAKKVDKRIITISFDTDCEMVQKMADDIKSLDARTVFTDYLNNPVYRSASRHLKHVACPVPSAVLKALEVESGVCLPKNVSITFAGNESLDKKS